MDENNTDEQTTKYQYRENFIKFSENILVTIISIFGISILGLLFLSYLFIVISDEWELAGKIYLPIKKSIELIHNNWIAIIPMLILIFYHPIYQLIERLEVLPTPFGNLKVPKIKQRKNLKKKKT
jgi:hypothetical protein